MEIKIYGLFLSARYLGIDALQRKPHAPLDEKRFFI